MSELARLDRLFVCDELKIDAPKTKHLVQSLQQLKQDDVLIVSDTIDESLSLSARNLYKVNVCDVKHLDPVILVGHEAVIMTTQAVKQVEEWLQ